MLSNPDFLAGELENQPSNLQELQSPEGELYLRFFVPSGYEFALPAIGIREVIAPAPDRITPIPNASPLLLGVLNLRGQVIWVADIGQFLGEPIPLGTDRAEIPVIAIEDQEIMVGLAVERVVGMDWLDLDKIHPSTNVPDGMTPFLRGEWPDQSTHRSLRLLDQIAILRSARWVT